ncbi:MAG TPA: ATP-binding protein [Lacunisphaera sp.]|nr:ATP-binding protein [Lacunisphaera sp.]
MSEEARLAAKPAVTVAETGTGSTPPDFTTGGGEMGERIQSFDWSRTPLGPIDSWSPALKMMVRFLLVNRFPMLLWWGPDFIQIYNDPYRPILGAKHPSPGLGQPVSVCWSEIWHILRPLIETPYRGGASTWMDDILLQLKRHGFEEETHFTIAYSPVPDDTVPEGIGGVLATVNEITEKVIAERRVALLRDLASHTGDAKSVEETCRLAAKVLATHDKDVPFVMLYVVEPQAKRARLAGWSGGVQDGEFAPATVDLTARDHSTGWPVAAAVATGTTQVVTDLQKKFVMLPRGPWSDPPNQAVVMPILTSSEGTPNAVMIVGLSSRLRFDDFYRDFLELVRAQVVAAITRARAYEDERRRAEALAELDRAKTAFFSNVSHEFRTPLTLMLGPVEDLLHGGGSNLAAAVRSRLDVVHRNSLRLLRLVNTLLDFSRIEAGRMDGDFVAVDLAAYTAELASVFRSAVEQAGLRLVVGCPRLPHWVAVDRDMWEKIVLNLLSNAFKYTLAGEIVVKLEAVGDGTRLTVRDTGVGIPAADLPRVFERFHRVRESRGRTHEGTGIGLALVQELVHLHGGTIRAESVVDCGTSFMVDLPSTQSRPLPAAGARPPSNPPLPPATANAWKALRWIPEYRPADADLAASEIPPPVRGSARKPRVLWVDDNADMRDYVSRLLANSFEVTAVGDGEAALEVLRADPPELVLSDVMLPRLNGFGLVRAIRSEPTLADIPVILLSARAGEEARVDGVASGADDYLIKPFSARELLARVGAHVTMSRARRAAANAVRESEERFRALATTGAYIIYRMSPDWTEMTALEGKGMLSDTSRPSRGWLANYIPLEEQSLVLRTIEAAIASRGMFELEHRVRRADGGVGWVLSRAVPLMDATGAIREWFGAASDVTVRKEAELALRAGEERLRAAAVSVA